MDLFDLIQSQLFNQNTMEQLAGETQAEPEKVERLTKLAIPTMLEALRNNASTEEGKQSLDRALNDHLQDPSDLMGFLRDADQNDGDKILNHMFGSNREQVTNNLANSSGLNIGSVISLLTKYAPMILSMLALSKVNSQRQAPAPTQKTNKPSGMDLTDILGDLTGRSKQASNQDGGLLEGLKDLVGGFLK